jgi:hypothetical protein
MKPTTDSASAGPTPSILESIPASSARPRRGTSLRDRRPARGRAYAPQSLRTEGGYSPKFPAPEQELRNGAATPGPAH